MGVEDEYSCSDDEAAMDAGSYAANLLAVEAEDGDDEAVNKDGSLRVTLRLML